MLQELSLAIPQGSITAVVGDIGSGEQSHPRALRNEPHILHIESPAREGMPQLADGRWCRAEMWLQELSLAVPQGSLTAIGW